MTLPETIFEMIDMRSFSNLWFWIALAVMWSSASHWVLGVPYDMIVRAKRKGGQAEIDLRDILRANINRMLYIADTAGVWLLGFGCFLLTGLGLLGFFYGVEFAQAVFLLMFPVSLLLALSLRTARQIAVAWPSGDALHQRLYWHRFYTQFLGIISIFVTALWGMYQNLSIGAL